MTAKEGDTICRIALDNNIKIEHACKCLAHALLVIYTLTLVTIHLTHQRMMRTLDKAWGLRPESRLSCQAKVAKDDLIVEIPKYTINHASENH